MCEYTVSKAELARAGIQQVIVNPNGSVLFVTADDRHKAEYDEVDERYGFDYAANNYDWRVVKTLADVMFENQRGETKPVL